MSGSVARFRYGDLEIFAIHDGVVAFPADLLSPVANEPIHDPQKTVAGDVNVFLVRGPAGVMLIDSGAGSSLGPSTGRLGEGLRQLGIAPADIAHVLLTHLHPDHVNGLVEGSVARFPSAVLHVSQREQARWLDDDLRAAATPFQRPVFDWAAAVLAAYEGRVNLLRDERHSPLPGVVAIPLPGHTPGHTAFQLGIGGETVIFAGDIAHFVAPQFATPARHNRFDMDPQRAAEERLAMLKLARDCSALLAGCHLPFPGLGRVRGEGSFFFEQITPLATS